MKHSKVSLTVYGLSAYAFLQVSLAVICSLKTVKERTMKKLFALTVLVIFMCFVGIRADAEELYATYTEGIFQVKIPLNYTKVTGS